MAVLGIVPAEERLTERLGLALIPEPSGKRGMVLQGFELSLGKRVVIRHLRPAQRAGHAEVSEKLSGASARHWSSPIRVQVCEPVRHVTKHPTIYHLACAEDFDQLFEAIIAVAHTNVFNSATALRIVAELALERLADISGTEEARGPGTVHMNPTVSSAEIREATGLSQKTLTRWHKGGHIPVPEIGQHPGGRGKMGYYPDHALALVRRIVALKKEGQPLKQAASQAGHEFEQREESGRPSMLDPITIESICKGIRIGPDQPRCRHARWHLRGDFLFLDAEGPEVRGSCRLRTISGVPGTCAGRSQSGSPGSCPEGERRWAVAGRNVDARPLTCV